VYLVVKGRGQAMHRGDGRVSLASHEAADDGPIDAGHFPELVLRHAAGADGAPQLF
jgi:hypothetical protein